MRNILLSSCFFLFISTLSLALFMASFAILLPVIPIFILMLLPLSPILLIATGQGLLKKEKEGSEESESVYSYQPFRSENVSYLRNFRKGTSIYGH